MCNVRLVVSLLLLAAVTFLKAQENDRENELTKLNLPPIMTREDHECSGNECIITDDPILMTFDCVRYEYHGRCSYTLIRTCGNTSIPLEIIGHFERLEYHPKMSVMKSLEVHIENSVIVLNEKFEIFLNEQQIASQTTERAWGTIERYTNALRVNLKIGITVTWSSPFRAVFELDPGSQLDGILCGLCGINNGIKSDDLETADGQVVTDIVEFGDSWRTDPQCGKCRDCENTVCKSNQHNYDFAVQFCNIFVNGTLPNCNGDIDPQSTYQHCVDSMCAFLPEFQCVCSLVLDYVVPCLFLDQEVDFTSIGVCGFCGNNEYVCNNGQCIPHEWHCDGYSDCFDRSDENAILCQEFACNNDSFVCLSGKCIPPYQRCNGLPECSNGEDEANCPPPICYADEFICTDGTCVPGFFVCDGYDDCDNGTDEIFCEPGPFPPLLGCMANEFECVVDGDVACIPEDWYCDGIVDCTDAIDEPLDQCPVFYPSYSDYYVDDYSYGEPFVCDNGEQIPGGWYCDYTVDCAEGEDELNCICDDSEWSCDIGGCVRASWRCDNEPDCYDGSDEQNCTGEEVFMCDNGQLIPVAFYCDGIVDCAGPEDEINCICDDTQWSCHIGQCIPAKWRCDDEEDCYDGSDEYGCTGASSSSSSWYESSSIPSYLPSSSYSSSYEYSVNERKKRSSIQFPAKLKRSATSDKHINKHCSKIWRRECVALLPYTSTGIPNRLLHVKNRIHIDQVYKHIMSATNENVGKHQLFACALAFPECPNEGTGEYQVPCQHLCREVFADIGHHFRGMRKSSWPVVCDVLPDNDDNNDDLCTMIPDKR